MNAFLKSNWKYLIPFIVIIIVYGKDQVYFINGRGGKDWKIGSAKVNVFNSFQYRSEKELREFALKLVNRDRKLNDLETLKESESLHKSAQIHAEDMAKKDYFGYETPEGLSLTEYFPELKEIHVSGSSICLIAGDVSKDNYRLVELGQRCFMYEKGNREMILNQDYSEFGYGISTNINTRKTFMVQTFR